MRARKPMSTVLVAACAALMTLMLGGTPSALALSSERHYEMVSPLYKGGGYGVAEVRAVSPNGEAVAFFSAGSFAGATSGAGFIDYMSHRTASGWSTASLLPPAAMIVEKLAMDLTPSLSTALTMGDPGPNGLNPAHETDFVLHATDEPDLAGSWEFGGVAKPLSGGASDPQYEGASEDFCHFLILGTGPEQYSPEAEGLGGNKQLYDVSRGCGGSSQTVSFVGLNNSRRPISPLCDARLGDDGFAGTEAPQYFNAVSADGSEVFFETCTMSSHQVFVRLGGSRTLEISRPLNPPCEAGGIPGEVPCKGAEARASADFKGASEDGSRVYFTAPLASGAGPLVPGDEDVSNNLYVAKIGCPASRPGCAAAEREVTSLSEASHDPYSGQAAGVLGVTRVAPDGSRAYFVAEGDLLSQAQRQALEGERRPVPHAGAANLYVYDDQSQTVTFIGDLCSGSFASGAVEDARCPGAGSDEHLWNVTAEETQAQTAGTDGRFLVFATYAQLASGDTNPASDVYRYDAETGSLQRVSTGEDGFDDNGNRTVLGASGEVLGAGILPGLYSGQLVNEHGLGSRAASEDGSRIVFVSAEPLSPMAANGLDNAYEWHEGPGGSEGSVSLVSSGHSSEPVKDVTISADGSSVFFVTVDGLVPQDTDGLPDVYDARLGAGFPQAPANGRPCEGDACQGPLTTPAPLLVPGSVLQAPGGNFASPAPSSAATKRATAKAKPTKGVKRKRRGRTRASRAVRMGAHTRGHRNASVRSGL